MPTSKVLFIDRSRLPAVVARASKQKREGTEAERRSPDGLENKMRVHDEVRDGWMLHRFPNVCCFHFPHALKERQTHSKREVVGTSVASASLMSSFISFLLF